MAKASRSALIPHAADVLIVCGRRKKTMAYATIALQNQTLQIQTVPGSGVIKLLLPEGAPCFYNPATGLFDSEPTSEGGTPDLVTQHLPELKQKLNEFDAARRAAIAATNRLSAGA